MQAPVRANRNRTNAARAIPLKRTRFWLICLFFLLWALAIAGRLFWLQIVRHQEFVDRAQKQQSRTFEVAPRRGVLYDRNLHELAMTDRKSTRLNSSHLGISYAVFCLKK